MNKIHKFIQKWKREGLREAIEAIFSYTKYVINSTNLKNAIKFRDPRIYFSCDIGIELPESTIITHPLGIVVGNNVDMGENVKINQNVTIGGRGNKYNTGQPIIKDNVKIYSGAVVLGEVTLEEGCTVGANAVVLEDVCQGETVVGVPASKI